MISCLVSMVALCCESSYNCLNEKGADLMRKCDLCGHWMAADKTTCSNCGFRVTESNLNDESRNKLENSFNEILLGKEASKDEIAKRIKQISPNKYEKYSLSMKFFLALIMFSPAVLLLVSKSKTTNVYFKYILLSIFIVVYIIVLIAG